jgi:hypothetical protein
MKPEWMNGTKPLKMPTKVDLNKTLTVILNNLEGSSGAFHPAAASLDINDLPKFLQLLTKHIERMS